MDYSMEEKPLTVGLNNKAQQFKVNKTYFYEMPTGNIEPVETREAWELYKKKYKQIGVSNGLTYDKARKEAKEIFKTEGIEKAQERLRQGIQEELEVARGNFETPPNCDMFGNGVPNLRTKLEM